MGCRSGVGHTLWVVSLTLPIRPLVTRPNVMIEVPGSKSHTNRALVCAALGHGRSRLEGVLLAEDTWAMLDALAAMGFEIDIEEGQAVVEVEGCGGRLPGEAGESLRLDVRQSGTTGRFILPLLTLGSRTYELDGGPQLRERPFGDLLDGLDQLGARIEGQKLPLRVQGSGLVGGKVRIRGDVSSQYLSGLLLSAPCAQSDVVIELTSPLVSRPYIELTLSTMTKFGATVLNEGFQRFVVANTGYQATTISIEPDASAASYFFAAAAVTGGSVTIEGLGTETVQGDLAFVDVLASMGAAVTRHEHATTVVGPDQLSGVEVDMADISDTAQTLAAIAPFATSPTKISGIGFIRRKETDRIGAVVQELGRLGVRAFEEEDGFRVEPGRPGPGLVHTYNDHRMAMSFALVGLVSSGIVIDNPGCVSKTFPSFFEVLDRLRSRAERAERGADQ